MITIDCPFCGPRDHAEFTYERADDVTYPALDAPQADWMKAVFERNNTRGVVPELWQHARGCRMWLVLERDTLTHHVVSVRPAHAGLAAALAQEAAR